MINLFSNKDHLVILPEINFFLRNVLLCFSVFDTLLYRPATPDDIPHYDEVQRVLREEIVNPLRQNLYVRADRVMKLRKLMEQLSSVSGLTTDEKGTHKLKIYSAIHSLKRRD